MKPIVKKVIAALVIAAVSKKLADWQKKEKTNNTTKTT